MVIATLRAGALRGYVPLVRQLGGDPERLLKMHGLPTVLNDEDQLLPGDPAWDLLETTAMELGCPDFGLRLAQQQDISILGAIGVAIRHSATVGEALDILADFLPVHGSMLSATPVNTTVGAKVEELRFEQHTERSALRQSFDVILAIAHRSFQQVLPPRQYQLLAVHFPHAPAAPKSRYASNFGVPVRFNQRHASFLFRPGFFAQKIAVDDVAVKTLALRYLQQNPEMSRLSVTTAVRTTISRMLGIKPITLQEVSMFMGIHPRKLQRELQAEETNFEQVKEAFLSQLAKRYLESSNLSLSQITDLLGLSEQSALSRSCKRWFNQTPLDVRRNAGTRQSGDRGSKPQRAQAK